MFVILLSYVKPLEEVDRWVDEHNRHQVADYEIIEFLPTMAAPDLAHLK